MSLVIALHVVANGALPASSGAPPNWKRGPQAWANFVPDWPHRFPKTANRLLAHAIDDFSNAQYLKDVRQFLMNCKMHNIPVRTWQELDLALSREMELRCYGLRQNVGRGDNLLHGIGTLYPQAKQYLHVSRRALEGWRRNTVAGEGKPLWQGTVLLIVESMLADGDVFEALAVLFSYDTFARSSDWMTVNLGDLKVAAPEAHEKAPRVTVTFGASDRGLSAKTGPNQKVTIDDEWLRRILVGVKESSPGDVPLFPFEATHFRKVWGRHLAKLQLGEAGGPVHSLRHSRPSQDVHDKKASLEDIRRRGRWRRMKSVQRYSKEALIVENEAMLSHQMQQRGRLLRGNPVKHLLERLRSGKGKSSYLGRIMVREGQMVLKSSKTA